LIYVAQSAVLKVFEDEEGMLPNLLTFMSQSDKLLRMSLVSKTLNRLIRLPQSWLTAEVIHALPLDKCPVEKDPRMRTVLSTDRVVRIDDMPLYIQEMKSVEHLCTHITTNDLDDVFTKWPKLQTLRLVDRRATADRVQRTAGILLQMKCLRDLTLGVNDFSPQSADWESFESVERFDGFLDQYISDTIVAHGGKLRHINVVDHSYALGKTVSPILPVIASRGNQLELLDLWTIWASRQGARDDTDHLLDAIAEHSGRLRALHISGNVLCEDNIDKLVNVVAANQSTLRALSVDIMNEHIAPGLVYDALQTMYTLCGDRLEYIRVHIYPERGWTDAVPRYQNIPREVVRLFRFADVSINQVSVVDAADKIAVLCRDVSTVMRMYADGLSLYPARV
jgi:hypothetical protein